MAHDGIRGNISRYSRRVQREMQRVKAFEQELMKDRAEYIIDVLEYTQRSFEEVYSDFYRGDILMRDEWIGKNPQTPEEIGKFYRETKNYLFDLGRWHFGIHRRFDLKLLAYCLKSKPKKVLDFGAGIGQNAYLLANKGIDVVVADVDSYTLDFAEFRFKKHHVPATFWRVDKEPVPDASFDMILCFDVLEHLPLEEAKKTVELLGSLKASRAEVLLTAPFEKTSSYPMHFNRNEELDKLIQKFLSKDVLYTGEDVLYTEKLDKIMSKAI